MSHRKADGGPLTAKVYGNKRSALFHLFNKYYDFAPNPKEFVDVVQTITIDGLKRLLSKATTRGIGKIEKGKREMSIELYEKLNEWFIKDGSRSSVFARAFLCVSWNLLSRSDNTKGICIKNIDWTYDCAGIEFSHTKNDQEGSRAFKKRHIYANPNNYKVSTTKTIAVEEGALIKFY